MSPLNDPLSPLNAPPLPAPRKKRGCFFYGCLTLVIVTILAAVAVFFTAKYALNKLAAYIEQYTDTAPAPLPPVEVTPNDYEKLQERLTAFQEAMDGGKGAEALTLTAAELNALIVNHASLREWKDRLRVSLEGDQVQGQLCLPLDAFAAMPGLSRLKGRYLNGSTVLKASLENGLLDVHMMSIEVKGKKPPEEVMAQLRTENLAKDVQNKPETAANLRKLESLEIKDGKLTLKARPPVAATPAP
jgi:hypothetical protein